MTRRRVIFYATDDGTCPVRDFLNSLPGKDAQKVTWVLQLVEDLDFLPATYFKKLQGTDGIWECRIQVGGAAYRLFCFFAGDSMVVLTHGMRKKVQKTPRREIERAETYRRDYLRRRL